MESLGTVLSSSGKETLIQIPLHKAPFSSYQYQHNRTINFDRVRKIKQFLTKYHQDFGYIPYVSRGWTVFIGRIQGTLDEKCMDGQHRWYAAYEVEQELQLGLTMNFLITDYLNEEQRILAFMTLSQGKEMEEMLLNNIPSTIQDQFNHYQGITSTIPRTRSIQNLSQTHIRRQFQEQLLSLIRRQFPQLIQHTQNPKKPYIAYTKLCAYIEELTDIVADKEKYNPNLLFPTLQQPPEIFKLIQLTNDIWLQQNNTTLAQYIPTQSGKDMVAEVKRVGGVLAYHKVFWTKFFHIISLKNKKCKIISTQSLKIKTLPDDETFYDTQENF